MMMKVLLAASHAAPPEVVRPVVAALGALDAEVSTVDLGRVGDTSSRLGRVVKAFIGEAEATRLVRELSARRPDVALAFDSGAAAALVLARDRRVSETAVVAVVPGFAADKAWAVAADRFAVVDDEVAVALADLGVDGARVLTLGPIVPQAIHEAAGLRRADVRGGAAPPRVGGGVEGAGPAGGVGRLARDARRDAAAGGAAVVARVRADLCPVRRGGER